MLARMNSETPPDAPAQNPQNPNPSILSPLEARVLGCLIEKELTTPDVYPLTLNSLVNAANQRSNRNPVLAATHEDVEHALDGLRQKRLVTHFAGAEARVAKFRHTLDSVYPLELTARVFLAELLLRGPQTTAELRMRGERMAAMPTTAGEADEILGGLAALAEPLVRKLPPQRGQKEARWAHLLSGEPAADASEPVPVTVTKTLPPEVEQRLAALEAEVSRLRNELDTLHKSLGVV